LILRCLDKIYNGEDVYEAKDYKKEELRDFLDNLNIQTFEKIQEFLVNSPKIEHKIRYKNEAGNDREIILSSLNHNQFGQSNYLKYIGMCSYPFHKF
jgi:hypothetical protein